MQLEEFKHFPDTYIHRFEQESDTGLEMNLLQKYLFVPLDIFQKIQHNKNGEIKIANRLEAWLAFLCMDRPEEIIAIIEKYPDFKDLYSQIYDMCRNIEEVMAMFSKELLEMDRNTVQLMIDDMQKELDETKDELVGTKGKLDEAQGQLDETKGQLDEARNYVTETLKQKNMTDKINVRLFCMAEEFLESVKKDEKYLAVFSDIEMDTMNGIELGKWLNKKHAQEKGEAIPLIFITSHEEFAIESYRLDAYQYILKEEMKVRIPEVLRNILQQRREEEDSYRVLETIEGMQKIRYGDILYIQKAKGKKYVEYYTQDKVYREQINMKTLWEELQHRDFVYADRSCLVNIEKVIQIHGMELELSGGVRIRIARRHLMELKECVRQYWERKKRYHGI